MAFEHAKADNYKYVGEHRRTEQADIVPDLFFSLNRPQTAGPPTTLAGLLPCNAIYIQSLVKSIRDSLQQHLPGKQALAQQPTHELIPELIIGPSRRPKCNTGVTVIVTEWWVDVGNFGMG